MEVMLLEGVSAMAEMKTMPPRNGSLVKADLEATEQTVPMEKHTAPQALEGPEEAALEQLEAALYLHSNNPAYKIPEAVMALGTLLRKLECTREEGGMVDLGELEAPEKKVVLFSIMVLHIRSEQVPSSARTISSAWASMAA